MRLINTQTSSVLIIYTGGTIGMYQDPRTGALMNFDFSQLASYVPELSRFPFNIECYTFTPPIDSSNMTPDHWGAIAEVIRDNYTNYDGFVILHGTDTMAYTASALSFMLQNLAKPVVLTGAQLPVGTIRTDGKENLLTALEIAAAKDEDGRAMVPEVSIYFQNTLLRGNRTTKINSEGFNAFRSYNCPPLAQAGTHISYNHDIILRPSEAASFSIDTRMDTSLALLCLFPGIRQEVVHAACSIDGIRALVLMTYGAGNAPQSDWLLQELRTTVQRGVAVVNVSQCAEGTVEMQRYATGLQLLEAGVINGHDCTLECTITKLMHLLGSGLESDGLAQAINIPLCGEMSV